MFSYGDTEFEDRVQVDGDLGVIHFRPLIKEDEGRYRCHAFSEAGQANVTGYLKVLSNYRTVSVLVNYQVKYVFFSFYFLSTVTFQGK